MKDKYDDFDLDIVYLDDEPNNEPDTTDFDTEIFDTASPKDDSYDDYKKPVRKRKVVKSAPPSRNKRRKKSRKRRAKKKGVSMPSIPVGKVAKGTGKAVYRIVGIAFRLATFAIIGYILYLLFTNFWAGKNEYGNIMTMIDERNYVLAAYSGTALFLLLFEFISLLWSASSQKIKDDDRVRNLDTGRGLTSFILIYAGAIAAKLFAHMIPASPAFLTGLTGALNIYGALEAVLLPLCIAGVVCSLLRKFIFH